MININDSIFKNTLYKEIGMGKTHIAEITTTLYPSLANVDDQEGLSNHFHVTKIDGVSGVVPATSAA